MAREMGWLGAWAAILTGHEHFPFLSLDETSAHSAQRLVPNGQPRCAKERQILQSVAAMQGFDRQDARWWRFGALQIKPLSFAALAPVAEVEDLCSLACMHFILFSVRVDDKGLSSCSWR